LFEFERYQRDDAFRHEQEHIMRIAILGTGHMARTLGAGFAKVGHEIVFGSRSPEQHTDLPAAVTDHASAIDGSDLVLSALAAATSLETLTGLREALAGHVVLDIGNAVNERMELLYPTTSLGEQLQQALPDSRVVKSLNTLPGTIAVAPESLSAPSVVFLSGDDADAKAMVSGLIGDLGWAESSRVDLGGIATALAAERYFSLFAALMGAFRGAPFNLALVR
jgi:8-hydroxy-5-deazaflavin:NADPH oxidoreductase